MALAPKGIAPPIFDLKSATLSMVALVLKTTDLAELRAELQARLGSTPNFFSHDPVLIDLAAVHDAPGPIDFKTLASLLRGPPHVAARRARGHARSTRCGAGSRPGRGE